MTQKDSLILLLLVFGVLFIVGCTPTPGEKTPDIPQNQPVPSENTALYVQLEEEFTLYENQPATIIEEDYSIKITNFFNSPCPQGSQCIWSGVGIAFEHARAGDVKSGIDLVEAFGYQTTILDTDHETYARLKVSRIE